MRITQVVGYLLEERVEKPFNWQVDRPGSGDGRAPDRTRTCLLRIVTDEGIEGCASMSHGQTVLDAVERRLGQDPTNTEWLWWRVWDVDRLEEFPIYVMGLADMALWDIKGKVAGLPVYKLLGGYRDRIPAYASTTSYDTVGEYLEVISACLDVGYKSIKLHLRYRDIESNIRLCEAVRKLVGDDIVLTLDASALWNYTESLRFGRALEQLAFHWYEEPMREFDLGSYAKLCAALDIPVLAAETSDGCHWNAAEFIRAGACDILRTSTHYKGGFTGGMKVAHLAESFGMNAEVHGGGLANLHLCLAIPNNEYYEDLVVDVEHVRGKRNASIPLGPDGCVGMPAGVVGVGHEVDVKDVEKRAVATVRFPG